MGWGVNRDTRVANAHPAISSLPGWGKFSALACLHACMTASSVRLFSFVGTPAGASAHPRRWHRLSPFLSGAQLAAPGPSGGILVTQDRTDLDSFFSSMADSGPLRTTPGQFDYPPASASAQMDASDGSSGRLSHPTPPSYSSARDSTATPPWIPSSPETRGRMQRVLRHVQELEDNNGDSNFEHTRRDIQRRLNENEHRLRLNVERLRVNGRRISEVQGQIREFGGGSSGRVQHTRAPEVSLPPISALSPHQPTLESSAVSTSNVTPIRAALREAGERLRQVNDELQSLLDRPIGAAAEQRQSSGVANNDMQRMVAQVQNLARLAEIHNDEPRTSQILPSAPLQNSLRRLRQFQADFEPLLDLYMPQAHDNANEQRRSRPSSSDRLRTRTAHQPLASNNTRGHATMSNSDQASPLLQVADDEAGHPKRKRRRLDRGHSQHPLPLIQYGYEGQVVPGRLKLELVSSDGGIVEPPMADFINSSYGAENVLKDDLSVYCTKSQRCNMVLQHQYQTTFCLERLVIKAPRSGFTDPVQEGLVFVSMRNDEIFDRTARYQIYSFPVSRFASHFASSADPDHGASLEIEHPVLEPTRPRTTLRDLNDSHEQTYNALFDDNDDNGNFYSTSRYSDGPDRRVSSSAVRRGDNERDSGEFSSDDASPNYPGHALSRMRERHFRSSGATQRTHDENIQAQRVFDNVLARGAAARQRRQRRQRGGSVALEPAVVVADSGLPLDFLTPAARFSMHSKTERDSLTYEFEDPSHPDSDTMTIEFDPPVSGKFILLKMWSTRHGGNIDVQNVSAYGFAGPRWFPSIECR